jgi:hypothetical protein
VLGEDLHILTLVPHPTPTPCTLHSLGRGRVVRVRGEEVMGVRREAGLVLWACTRSGKAGGRWMVVTARPGRGRRGGW